MTKITSKLREYLLSMILASDKEKLINRSVWAVRIIERGYIKDYELDYLVSHGYRP